MAETKERLAATEAAKDRMAGSGMGGRDHPG